jgi:hypothetical protein
MAGQVFRYSRTLTPKRQAARQSLRPSRFRSCSIIAGYEAKVATSRAENSQMTRPNELCG